MRLRRNVHQASRKTARCRWNAHPTGTMSPSAASNSTEAPMPGFISDSPLARDLIRVGNEAIAREDDVALRAYFSEDYVFHAPGGDLSFDQLRAYFASVRAAFAGLRLVREQIIVDSRFLAAR